MSSITWQISVNIKLVSDRFQTPGMGPMTRKSLELAVKQKPGLKYVNSIRLSFLSLPSQGNACRTSHEIKEVTCTRYWNPSLHQRPRFDFLLLFQAVRLSKATIMFSLTWPRRPVVPAMWRVCFPGPGWSSCFVPSPGPRAPGAWLSCLCSVEKEKRKREDFRIHVKRWGATADRTRAANVTNFQKAYLFL